MSDPDPDGGFLLGTMALAFVIFLFISGWFAGRDSVERCPDVQEVSGELR